MPEKIVHKLVGYRVRAAREAKGWTQDQLTRGLTLKDRQSVSDIENGKRGVKPDELLALAELLNREIEFFLDPLAVAGEARFSWRVAPTVSEEALDRFEQQASQWIGLLRWLRERQDQRRSVLKRTLRLTAQSSFEVAQARAEGLATELNLGLIPAETLIDQIERELDIPVLFVDMAAASPGETMSGATCHMDDLGAILINRQEPEGRRLYNLAHELFHALTWEAMCPDHRESNAPDERHKGKRIEHLADNFAAALLMPQSSLQQILDHSLRNDPGHLCKVAARLRVTPLALAWRLFNLKLIDDDTRCSLGQQKQRPSVAGLPKRFSPAFVQHLHEALDRGQLSARKAAKAMGLGLGGLNELFAEYGLPAPFEL